MSEEQMQKLIAKLREVWTDYNSDEFTEIGKLNLVAWIGERTPSVLKAFETIQAERDRYRAALEAVQAHHTELNRMAGRPESASTTLSIIREALAEEAAKPSGGAALTPWTQEILSALQALCDAIKAHRETLDRYMQLEEDDESSSHALTAAGADIDEANALVAHYEVAAREAIAKAKGGAA